MHCCQVFFLSTLEKACTTLESYLANFFKMTKVGNDILNDYRNIGTIPHRGKQITVLQVKKIASNTWAAGKN